MRLICSFFLLLFVSHFTMAQDISINKEINRIDSLIEYKQFDVAEKEADNLHKLLNEKYPRNQYQEEKALVHLLQGLVKDRQYQHNKALSIFLEVLKEAEKNNLYRIACRAKIYVALNYEKAGNTDLAYKYLEEARKMCREHHFNDLYSTLFIRYAQMYRYFGFENNPEPADKKKRIEKLGFQASKDSAFYYAAKAIEFAEKYNNENDVNDGYVVMGILNSKIGKTEESSAYYLKSLPHWKKTNNFQTVANMYRNVASNYIKEGKYKEALEYNAMALPYYKNMFTYHKYGISKQRASIYKELGVLDSAYHYLMLAYDDREKSHIEAELSTTRSLAEQYENDKKEAVIKSREQQLYFIGSLLAVIVFGSVMLYRKNRQINKQNRIINTQLGELTKTLEQKQVLLSELQHRVKNNLQHVISILEIQKESVNFNNIDELIRGNQNRIHSMALLHKKLNVSDHVHEVDVKRYVAELSELVKDSYDSHNKKVNLQVHVEVEKISLEKALPLGLIIVELVSNSMKHAFQKQNIGIISIELTKDSNGHTLYYSDNGSGFDFNAPSEKGLGQEIIKGLIDQLDGVTETKSDNGFELTVKL